MLLIEKAGAEHLDDVARLFDLYRQFYECEPDLDSARSFLAERLDRGESDVFIAIKDGTICGFTQLYASFCSVELLKIYILYDLYVDAPYRGAGVGAALMDKAAAWAEENGAGRIDLLTAKDNYVGQRLYERKGYELANENFFAYSYYLSD